MGTIRSCLRVDIGVSGRLGVYKVSAWRGLGSWFRFRF